MYSNPGSITYVETAYAIAHHDPCASVQNLPGDAFVQPSALADAEALLKAKLEPDLEQLLTGVFTDTNPKAYAISAYSYLVTPEGQMNQAKGAVLGQFIEFLACQGQQSAEQLGYSPLPPNLVDDDFQGIKRIAGAAPPPATVNAQTCNDPYVSLFGGSGPPSGGGGGGGVAEAGGSNRRRSATVAGRTRHHGPFGRHRPVLRWTTDRWTGVRREVRRVVDHSGRRSSKSGSGSVAARPPTPQPGPRVDREHRHDRRRTECRSRPVPERGQLSTVPRPVAPDALHLLRIPAPRGGPTDRRVDQG